MPRRYYLIIFIILFGFALWGIVNSLFVNAPQLQPPPPTTNTLPVVPAAATSTPQ